MKLGDLRKIFETADGIYSHAGNAQTAAALKEASSLCDGRETMTVAAFAKLVATQQSTSLSAANSRAIQSTCQSGGRGSTPVSELRAVLSRIQQLYVSAGAKTAAKELQSFSDILKPYSDMHVGNACTDIKHHLSQATAKSAKRSKVGAKSDRDAIPRHLAELRGAGTNQQDFDLAFQKLKASKSVKLADLAEIARQFSLSVTAYKSKAAAYSDIENAFVRQARFENKLR